MLSFRKIFYTLLTICLIELYAKIKLNKAVIDVFCISAEMVIIFIFFKYLNRILPCRTIYLHAEILVLLLYATSACLTAVFHYALFILMAVMLPFVPMLLLLISIPMIMIHAGNGSGMYYIIITSLEVAMGVVLNLYFLYIFAKSLSNYGRTDAGCFHGADTRYIFPTLLTICLQFYMSCLYGMALG